MKRKIRRVAVLWSRPSGYLSASLQALADRGCELYIATVESGRDAPFSEGIFDWPVPPRRRVWPAGQVDRDLLAQDLEAFDPDLVLCGGWARRAYLDAVRHLTASVSRVICFDTPWVGTLRQRFGALWARRALIPHFDFAFVPGERQVRTALRLGFPEGSVITGLYAPDANRFSGSANSHGERQSAFLYVGRLSPEKGVECLVRAYREYRDESDSPWPLKVAGTGPLIDLVKDAPGVELLGFVQPGELPGVMARVSCLVVPSLYEPWGVQISEGAAAGLPIIATTSCGAAVHLVQNHFNGLVVPSGDVRRLARALAWLAEHPARAMLGANSRALGRQYSPELFATRLLAACEMNRLELPGGEGPQ